MFRKQSNRKDLLTFTEEMASLLSLRAPLDHCLHSVANELEAGPVRQALEAIGDKVAGGLALSKAMAAFPDVFSEMYVRSVAAGEASGDLTHTFQFLSRQVENRMALERKLRGLSIYPVVVLFVTLIVLWVLLTQLVPVFENIVQGVTEGDATADIPMAIRVLIGVGSLVGWMPNWLSLLLGIGVGGFLLWYLVKGQGSFLYRLVMNLPWFSKVREESSLAVMTGVLGTSLQSGMPLDEALYLARDTVDISGLRDALSRVARGVQNGEKVGPLLERSGKFPPTFTWLVSMSEEEGTIAPEMIKLSDQYFEQANNSLSMLEKVIRPLLIIFLAAVVGLIVLLMFSALIEMPGLIPLGNLR